MRRTLFYLSVALLAFGIGSFVVFQIYLKTENAAPTVEGMKGSNISTQNFGDIRIDIDKRALETSSETQVPVKKSFTCRDKVLSVVLNDLRKDVSFNEDFENYLEVSQSSDCRSLLFIERLIDLNGDGIKEFIVRGNSSLVCGGTGNCQIWIYKKFGNGYKELLATGGEYILVKKNSTNGYKDIFVKDHESAYSSYQATFKFDRHKYTRSKCLFVEYYTPNKKNVTACAEESERIKEDSRRNKVSSGSQ